MTSWCKPRVWTVFSTLILATLVPAASINGLGFIFPDYDAVWKAMDGELGAYIRSQIAKAGLVPFEKIWDNGFRQITTSTKPINTPDDLKGFKIRVPVSPLWTSLFKALEAAPAKVVERGRALPDSSLQGATCRELRHGRRRNLHLLARVARVDARPRSAV